LLEMKLFFEPKKLDFFFGFSTEALKSSLF
jgi:hypothetical protein